MPHAMWTDENSAGDQLKELAKEAERQRCGACFFAFGHHPACMMADTTNNKEENR